jgi:DNA repair exonuclease SbcCD ATPase subunit
MHIAQIHISNILGVKELNIDAGRITEITGKNGSGKSSVIGAIRAALGASDVPTARLVHDGAESGSVVLVFNDGTTIRRTVKRDGTKLDVIDAEGNKYQKPQTVLDALYDITQFNPVKLLRDDKKSRDERTAIIIESMPVHVDADTILKLAPEIASQIKMIRMDRHGIEVLNDVYDRLFARRTEVNVQGKQIKSTVDELKKTLPAKDEFTDQEREAKLLADKAKLESRREQVLQEFAEKHRIEREAAMLDRQKTIEEAEAEMNAAIQKARETYETIRTKADADRDAKWSAADKTMQAGKEKKLADFDALYQPIVKELGAIAERKNKAESTALQWKIVEQNEALLDDLRTKSTALTESLERIKKYKLTELARSPLPGLEIREGEVYYEGIHFDQLNTAKRIQLVVELAIIRSGQIGVICVDGCEALDDQTMKALEMACTEKGLQMICTAVSNEPLRIATHKEVA